ncbi:MAG: 4a-hydroxytetrahydrobiopterin dehydratase [Bdellovibrionota bacterium]
MKNEEACSLENKSCIPCSGGVPPLSKEEIQKYQKEVTGWEVNSSGHLFKTITFKDFMGAMNLANKIAVVAEKEGHHPDITIAWGKCTVEIWTHKINGLTESDFILAAKIDAL